MQRHTRRYPEPAMMKAKTLTLLLALSTGCTAAKAAEISDAPEEPSGKASNP